MKLKLLIIIFVFSQTLIAQINSTSFAPKVDYLTGVGTSNPLGVTAADLDNDGKKEVIAGNASSSSISIFRNISNSTTINLAQKVDYASVNPVNFVYAKDLDGDGKLDLIISSNSGSSFSIYRNTTSAIGSISFATRQDFVGLAIPHNFDIDDIDGDSKLDIVSVNYNSANFSIFRNTSIIGAISFATRQDISCGANPTSLSILDIDGDTKKDIAITIYTSAQVSVFRNVTISAGSPAFTNVLTISVGAYPHFIKNADLDADGKMDLVTGNFVGNNISVLKNTTSSVGSISFQAAVNITSGSGTSNTQGISLTDYDNDRKIDICAVNRSNNNISIFKNTAISGVLNNSSFATQVNFSVNSGPTDVFSSDLNGDDKPEILVTNNGTDNISILRNQILANEPTISASNMVFSNNGSTSTTLTFTKGNGGRRIVLAKALSAVNALPSDSLAYTSKDTFGLGTQIGTGNYVVYNDTGNTVNVKGLTAGINYHFAIYEYNGTNAYSNYLTSSNLVGNLVIGLSFYSKSTGNLNSLSTWGTNLDGTGTSPISFSNNGTNYYVVNNGSPTISADWFVTGSNTNVVFGDGTNSGNFIIPTGLSFGVDSFYVRSNFTFTIQGQIFTNKAGFQTNSTVQYVLNTPQNIITASYGNLVVSGSTKTILGNVTVKGVLAMFNNINCNGNTLTLGESTSQTGTLNRSSGTIIGNFKRWFAAATNTGSAGLMPIGTATVYRPIQVNFTSIPSSGGALTALFVQNNGGNLGFPIFDFTTSPIVQLTKSANDGYWRVTPTDGISGGAYTCTVTGTGFSGISSVSDLRLVRRSNATSGWSLGGTSVLGTGTAAVPVVSSIGITTIGGEFGIASDSIINSLPVKLISLTATWNNNKPKLAWKTASEENNSHFEVERLENNIWLTIGTIKGAGNSSLINSYGFIDHDLLDNNQLKESLYYRLKQVDNDGTFSYSDAILLQNNDIPNDITLYPIPLQNTLIIETNKNDKINQVVIYTIQGLKIGSYVNQNKIDLADLSQGAYIINVITNNGQSKTIRVVK